MIKLSKYKRIYIILLTYSVTTELLSTNTTDWDDISVEDIVVPSNNSLYFSEVPNFESNNVNNNINVQIYSSDDFFSIKFNEEIRVDNPILPARQIEKTDDKKRKKDNLDEKEGLNIDKKKIKKSDKKIYNRVASIDWTSEVEEYMKSLRNKEDPLLQRQYTYKEITDKMNKKFTDMTFTVDAVIKRCKKIMGNKLGNRSRWTPAQQEYLIELKKPENPINQTNYTWEEIKKHMNEKFSDKVFTIHSLKEKWKSIQIKNKKKTK